jgi:hypothetical protein
MPFTHLPQPFSRSECLTSGVTARVLERAARVGHLSRLAPGLYALAPLWEGQQAWERHQSLARAAARITPDAIVSHASAAALLGLPMPTNPPSRATMTLLDDGRTSRMDDWRRFHRGFTPHQHVRIDHGIASFVPARVVIDCLRDMAPGDALAVIDAALSRGLVTGTELLAVRRLQRRWPGIAIADQLLRLADGRRESWLESSSAWAMANWDLPAGIPQVVVKDGRGRFVARVDGLWPDLGVVGEADGRGKYLLDAKEGDADEEAAASAVLDQSKRESRVRDLGLEVVRWDTQDLGRPLVLRERFLSAAARARPDAVTAHFECSCCRRPLTDCAQPTRITRLRAA